MKRNSLSAFWVVVSLLTLLIGAKADALTFTFSDKDYLSGASWGTMTITAFDQDTLQIRFDASPSSIIPAGSEFTGFGFTFNPSSTIPSSVTNPLNSAFTGDRDDLVWIKLNNLNAIPQPANRDEFNPQLDKSDYFFGATEGNANNINPPGILPGQFDVFYLNFSNNLPADLASFVDLTGIRIQSITGIDTGSLFLAGKEGTDNGGGGGGEVPEPGTAILLGAGLLGCGFFGRRKPGK